MCVVI